MRPLPVVSSSSSSTATVAACEGLLADVPAPRGCVGGDNDTVALGRAAVDCPGLLAVPIGLEEVASLMVGAGLAVLAAGAVEADAAGLGGVVAAGALATGGFGGDAGAGGLGAVGLGGSGFSAVGS